MSINLPANLDTISPQELAILTGQTQERDGNGLPTLRVNYEDQDDDGNKIPRGEWVAYRPDGVKVFSPIAKFRPILSVFQYNHYDADKQELVSKSVYFRTFKDEVPDTAGGFRCGKVKKKDFDKMPPAEQEIQKKIKLSRVLFGSLSLQGVDQKGAAQEIVDMPCMFYARGSHYMPMTNFIEALKVPMQQVEVEMALNRVKNGGVVYWEVVPSYNREVVLPITKDTLDLLRQFGDTVGAENDQILTQHKQVRAKGVSPRLAAVAEAYENAPSSMALPDDDEIPF